MSLTFKIGSRRRVTLGKRDYCGLNAMDRLLINKSCKNLEELSTLLNSSRSLNRSDIRKIIELTIISECLEVIKVIILIL